ncbi:MAG: Gfo/Idh/MocA family oxidoreductase [Saccharofermentanales bacterium]
MKRFFPAVRKMNELIPSLGTIFSTQIRTYQAWGNLFDITDPENFNWILEGYGGGVIKCAGSHMLDLMLHFLGRPERSYASVDYVGNSSLDRKAVALFEYSNGSTVSFEAAAHPLKKIGFERNSWDEHIQINGVNGRLDLYPVIWNEPMNNAALLVHYDNISETSTEYRFDRTNPFDVEISYFCDCLERREQGHPDVIDGFNADVLIHSLTESGKTKLPVVIDWKGL